MKRKRHSMSFPFVELHIWATIWLLWTFVSAETAKVKVAGLTEDTHTAVPVAKENDNDLPNSDSGKKRANDQEKAQLDTFDLSKFMNEMNEKLFSQIAYFNEWKATLKKDKQLKKTSHSHEEIWSENNLAANLNGHFFDPDDFLMSNYLEGLFGNRSNRWLTYLLLFNFLYFSLIIVTFRP